AMKYGMPETKIRITGLPIDPKFFLKDREKQAARKKDHLKPTTFTVLMMGGGEGAGSMYEIVEEMSRKKLKTQVIIIAGRNKKLENKFRRNQQKFCFPIRVYGFTDKVHELMAESDVIITKAGPGSIAEALAMDLPMIITSWLPGQEEGNVEYVIRENIGKVSKDPQKVVEILKSLMQPAEYEKIKKNIKRVSRPQAAMEIAHEIFRFL
ncbi:MAG: glycosyltransferase, partial [Candidatus Saganbacteria bacterium]|nr:glycosyltransferase [Candidatus Saganbacteria bacterium]